MLDNINSILEKFNFIIAKKSSDWHRTFFRKEIFKKHISIIYILLGRLNQELRITLFFGTIQRQTLKFKIKIMKLKTS